jgi:hypothetical protein
MARAVEAIRRREERSFIEKLSVGGVQFSARKTIMPALAGPS